MNYAEHWNSLLTGNEKDNVDVIVSIHEQGINHLLSRHFEIDKTLPLKDQKYFRVFEKKFKTFEDERKFKITLELLRPIEVRFPPFTFDENSKKENSKKWQKIDYPINGPELIAKNSEFGDLIEVVAPEVSIKMEWPKLNGTGEV